LLSILQFEEIVCTWYLHWVWPIVDNGLVGAVMERASNLVTLTERTALQEAQRNQYSEYFRMNMRRFWIISSHEPILLPVSKQFSGVTDFTMVKCVLWSIYSVNTFMILSYRSLCETEVGSFQQKWAAITVTGSIASSPAPA
jgi:hypothetical protein